MPEWSQLSLPPIVNSGAPLSHQGLCRLRSLGRGDWRGCGTEWRAFGEICNGKMSSVMESRDGIYIYSSI